VSLILRIIFSSMFVFYLSACSTTKPSTNEDVNRKIATAKLNTQLGMTYLEKHNMKLAKQKLLLALDQAPNIPDTWYSMGYFLEVTGEKEQAKKYYLKSVELAPGRGDVQNNYGTFLCRSGEYSEAIEHFQVAAKDINYIDTAAAYENAGLCALKIPDNQLASQYFKKAITDDPNRASVYLELAGMNYQSKNYKIARGYLEQFLQLSPPTRESFRLSDQLDDKLGIIN
jgi:type IV pilus assembly protein PilF